MKRILIATDFSSIASNAANYAIDMALATHADVFIMHVANIPIGYSEVPVVITEEEMLHNAEKHMLDLKEELNAQARGKINIETEVSTGVFFDCLNEICDKVKPYAVVIGSHGKSAIERIFFGSEAVNAMKHLMWPLIAVPREAKFSLIKKIGLACDFDHVVETTNVDEIKTLVNDFHAELHVLNIGKKEEYRPEVVFQSGLLQEMLKDLRPDYHFIASENTDQGIIDFAEQNHFDLLIVLPKRHSLMDKLLHKSFTKQLVLHSHVPVMALHQG